MNLTDEQMASMPAHLLDRYRQAFRQNFQQRCQEHFIIYSEHIRALMLECDHLKKNIDTLEEQVEVRNKKVTALEEEIRDLKQELKIAVRDMEQFEHSWKRTLKNLTHKEHLMDELVAKTESTLRRVHDKQLEKLGKQHEKDKKQALRESQAALKTQRKEAALEMKAKEAEVSKLQAEIKELKMTILEKEATIKEMDNTVLEERRHHERLQRGERMNFNRKYQKLEEDHIFLKECFESFLQQNLPKQISNLQDQVARANIVVMQKDQEVALANREAARLDERYTSVRTSNVQLHVELAQTTEKSSSVQARYDFERGRHKDMKQQLKTASARLQEAEQDTDFYRRRSLALENETKLLQQKLKRSDSICERFQLDLQACVEVMSDHTEFGRKFKELVHVHLDKERLKKLGGVVEDFQKKVRFLRAKTANMREHYVRENQHLKTQATNARLACLDSFVLVREYNHKLTEDLGQLRETIKEEEEEQLRELGPRERRVNCVDSVPTSSRPDAQYREQPGERPKSGGRQVSSAEGKQPKALPLLVSMAKIHAGARRTAEATRRSELLQEKLKKWAEIVKKAPAPAARKNSRENASADASN